MTSELIFSLIGFDSKEIIVGGQSFINITLSESANNMNDVVVIGYGTMKKKDITRATVNVAKLQNENPTSPQDVLCANISEPNEFGDRRAKKIFGR